MVDCIDGLVTLIVFKAFLPLLSHLEACHGKVGRGSRRDLAISKSIVSINRRSNSS